MRIASKTASTATSALTFVMAAVVDTSLMMSTLIMAPRSSLLSSIDTIIYGCQAPLRRSAMPAASAPRRNRSVVLIGRPNVGKSTLFNRVCGSRRAIVAPVAGTTRDVIRAASEWLGTAFELVDTGGLFGASTDPMHAAVAAQGERALEGAHVVVVLVDGRDGVVPADWQVADRARRVGAPLILAVNKVDDRRAAERVEEFHALGIAPLMPVAAEHGLGIGELLDAVTARLPAGAAPGGPAAAPAGPAEIGGAR
ncbi:MAG: GTP-binding protein, partial [Acidobacteria bacterium]|nr:GTP-binding protein [Acidobacteriota bacterium]